MQTAIAAAGILVVVAAVYAKVVGFGPVPVWDDGKYLMQRAAVTDWWSVPWRVRLLTPEIGYPVPVPTFLYAHARLLTPDHYFGLLHGLNLGIHLGNCLLVFALARSWTGRWGGLAVMALWGLHPVNVESVAWLTNLKTVLGAASVLGCMLLWRRYVRARTSDEPWPAGPWLVGAVLAVGLGCRPDVAIAVPVMALQTWHAVGLAGLREYGRQLAAYAALGGGAVAVGLASHGSFVTVASTHTGSLGARLARIAKTFELSVTHLVWPLDLHPGYYLEADRSWGDAVPGLVLMGLVAAGAAYLAVRERWRAFFPVALFLILYAPYSNLRFLPRIAADTYQYLPSFAAILGVVVGVRSIPERWRGRLASLALVLVVGAGYAAVSAVQVDRWRDTESLWTPVIAEYPRLTRPYTLLGQSHVRNGRWTEARELMDAAVPLYRGVRRYPFYLPLVYEQTGAPGRAVALAREMVAEGAQLRDQHYKVFADVLARQEAPFPTDEPHVSALRRAVEAYAQRETWMATRNDRLVLADYLTKHGWTAESVPFLQRELASDRPHCFTWVAIRRLSQEAKSRLDAPPPPDRCLD